jgi:hypothetical protein
MTGSTATPAREGGQPFDPMHDPCPQCGAQGRCRCRAAVGESCPEGVLTPDEL